MVNHKLLRLQYTSMLFFDRHAWKILLAIILLIGFFGISDMIGGATDLQNGETILMHSLTGKSWDDLRAENPQAAHLLEWKYRADGASLFTIALLGMAICLAGFRRGDRWAWYALWALVIWMLLTVFLTLNAVQYSGYGTPVPVLSGSILCVLWVTCLVVTFRKFFPKREG